MFKESENDYLDNIKSPISCYHVGIFAIAHDESMFPNTNKIINSFCCVVKKVVWILQGTHENSTGRTSEIVSKNSTYRIALLLVAVPVPSQPFQLP